MIGIIAAMAEEAVYLKDSMAEVETSEIAGNIFYLGFIKNIKVVLAQSGIGKVNAAVATTLMIEHFKPDYIINTGCAGGLHESLNVGDVLISMEVRHHDVDLTIWGYEPGQLPKLPPAFFASEKLIHAAEAAALELNMGVTKGMIVSGDVFMHQDEQIAQVRKTFPSVQAVEMEAAAVAQVCHLFKVPFVVIRALSDIAGKDSVMSSNAFLDQAANSTQLILNMISH